MSGFSRRRLLQSGAALGLSGVVSTGVGAHDDGHGDDGDHDHGHHSPDLEKYVQELPVPEVRTPDGSRRGGPYHDVTIEETTHSFHPDLDETTIWGYDGQFPGPIIEAERNRRLSVEVDNSELPGTHLFDVDERIPGTTAENYVGYDGPVPDVRNSTHFHGLDVATESDGQADMWISPDGSTGPRRSVDVQEIPNRQSRLTSTYHDHTRGITRLNNYAGLVGPYYITSQRERDLGLPDGEYDVPLVLADRSFHDDGELYYPDGFEDDFAGDTMTVNGAAWPYLEVEPRRYRLRVLNVSNARTFDLELVTEDDHGDDGDHDHGDDDDGHTHANGMEMVPPLHQISPGHGFLEEVVEIGHMGDLHSLLLAPFERADVIVDFSDFAGETFTLVNHAEFPYMGDMDHGDHDHGDMDTTDDDHDHGDDEYPQIHEVMQIRVAHHADGEDASVHPSDLQLPNRSGLNPETARAHREITMGMEMDEHGLMAHTLNDRTWGDPVEIKPQFGSTEVWDLVNDDHHSHPIHLHLVEFDVVGRKQHDDHDHGDDHDHDMVGDDDDHGGHHDDLPTYEARGQAIKASRELGLDGRIHEMGMDGEVVYAPGADHHEYMEAWDDHHGWDDPRPNERGGKDTVLVDPGETVRIAVKFERDGMYPFHCHVLEHEDYAMMRPFEVVRGNKGPGLPGRGPGTTPPGHDDDHPGRGHGRFK
ncbi:multicopper oxidase family protein [Halovivax gelatinilyticus]|uniref:multicopper oxidase family protein n=1 Tax=Halovivax gelatinilyticus TaxID=2961597 RepID=UPI0020CA7303|nr:multicopper oxidase domain-containing protein [Halovivax gelatinilyticus]